MISCEVKKSEIMEHPLMLASDKKDHPPIIAAVIRVEYIPLLVEPWMVQQALRRAARDLSVSISQDQRKGTH